METMATLLLDRASQVDSNKGLFPLLLLAAFTHFLEKRATLFRTHGFHALDHLGREAIHPARPLGPCVGTLACSTQSLWSFAGTSPWASCRIGVGSA
jgi:hypothetical protein